MKPAGWIIMLLSLAGVWTLVGWCYYRVLTSDSGDSGGNDDNPHN